MRNGGIRNETRSSALWGTGNRGGESRSSALWGKGGRGAITALAAMLVLSVPFAASAPKHGRLAAKAAPKQTWISPGLMKGAKQHPNQYVRVIIQSTTGSITPALSAFTHVNQFADDDRGGLQRRLSLVDGVAATVRLRDVARLAKLRNLIVTPDVQVHVSGYSSNQLWPYETGVSKAWSGSTLRRRARCRRSRSSTRASRPGARTSATGSSRNVKFSTLPNDSPGDGRGHGTFVAGIAAGAADNYTGATPQAPIVSLDVMDDNGVARTSDVIAAAQWILANKAKYNIRVANFSLHSATKSHFFQDPLDQAVEKLWFNNVVVVAAAGNYGYPDKPERRALRAWQRPLRDHRRRDRHRRHEEHRRRHQRSLVGLRPHARRLHEARAGGSRPVHGRPGAGGLDARGAARRQGRRQRATSSCRAPRSRHR